jgi:uncharacterized protein (TIGR00375 family)
MKIITDLHIHSRFSRATSNSINIENLEKWARIKGLNLLGTGDFSHPLWNQELKKELVEDGSGILRTRTEFPFLLTNEISLMYTQDGKGRRIHLVLLAPSFEVVSQITEYLLKHGRVDYDGRPIFNIPCDVFAEDLMKISKDIEIIPAHCLLPVEYIHTNKGVKRIKDLNKKDFVLTHLGRFRKVKDILKRDYSGKIYKIIPWYFTQGIATTPEHPFLAIKSYKSCSWTKGLCKPLCSQKNNCKKKYYEKYFRRWVMAKDLSKGDFLVYPRITKEKDFDYLTLTNFVKNYKKFNEELISPKNSRNNRTLIKNKIPVNKNFCRLIGYFLSEGYLIKNGAIGFSFNSKEKEYIKEVILFIKEIFGVVNYKIDSRRENQSDIIFFSCILNEFFKNFYNNLEKRAWSKKIPEIFLNLSNEKLTEILRGWWRGDLGYTVSRQLVNQMKFICIKLAIIPSISVDKKKNFNKRRKHFIGKREIISKKDLYIISNLSFFDKSSDLLNEKCFKRSINKIERKHGWIDGSYIYLPIRKISLSNYSGEVYNLEVEEDNSYVSEFACVHNCWTPWFGIFGSVTGFNSMEEAFKDKVKYIHAFETGMSSDPEMNWRLSKLDKYSIVSFSDSHSFWPWRIGREATAFDLKNFNYKEIIGAIRAKEVDFTIETSPSYGKYHFDGHRVCKFSCSPEEAIKRGNKCPVCGKQLTIGVLHRVEELADKPLGFRPSWARPFKEILPLHEIISMVLGTTISAKKVWLEYNKLINGFQNEFNILLNVSSEELSKFTDEKIARAILKNRESKISVKPGFDGEYGKAFLEEEQKKLL